MKYNIFMTKSLDDIQVYKMKINDLVFLNIKLTAFIYQKLRILINNKKQGHVMSIIYLIKVICYIIMYECV